MEVSTEANFIRTTLKVTVSIDGLTEDNMKGPGKPIKWKEKEFSLGSTRGSTKVSTEMTRRMVLESSHGLMGVSTMVSGIMGSSMG